MKNIKYLLTALTIFLVGISFLPVEMYAQEINTFNTIGGFESSLPSYWNMGNQPSGATLTWATDQYRSMGHSLEITKSTTSDTAAWVSDNMADIWSQINNANVDIFLGAYIKTQGVNTNPTSDDQRWYIAYTFYDSAGGLIGQTKLPIDQSVANSSGWVADTNAPGQTILPKDSWKTIISFVGGKNATGTVWADDFMLYGRNGAWAGQDWNTGLGVPTGWYYWLPPNGGNDGLLSNGFENTEVTSEAAHTGTHSIKFYLPSTRDPHDGFVGTKRYLLNTIDPDIKPGDILRISVWIKADSLQPDSADANPTTWSVGLTPGFFNGNGNNIGYNPISQNDYQFKFPHVTSFDWTQYHLDIQVPSDPTTNAVEVRLHVYARFTGIVYFDDLNITKLPTPDLNAVGGFESSLPSYWSMGNQPSGATLTWATDQYRSMGHSLEITKSTTSDTAAWVSDNMADIWSQVNNANVDIFLGAYIKTQGVNTNPTSDDQRWYIAYTFYDSAGALIGQTKLPIDQSVASSSGWVADTNAPGQTILPKDSWKTIISFVGGKNATGTVWADDFMLYGRNGAWAGQDWNTGLGVPTGWYYWLPPNGGNDGLLNDGFENTEVTSEAAHTGTYSLKFDMPANRDPHDGFVGTKRFLFNNTTSSSFYPTSKTKYSYGKQLTNVNPGDILRISVWIKADSLQPDSADANPVTWAVGLTPGFFAGNGNNIGYNPISQNDYQFKFPHVTSFDWTEYHLDVKVPSDATVNALEVRLHVYARFTGKVYFDDLSVTKLSVPDINLIGGFESSLPSYWNMGNQPSGATLTWATDQYRSMGHSLEITKSTTSDTAAWVSDNMADIWSQVNNANVDIFLGAYIKTQGVNTNPTSDDQRWYIAYTFYDSAGALIGQTKLPIDQSVASSSGWVADTNAPGQTILPKDSWKTIISFVGGKNATGTVWADDFMLYGRNGAWAGQDWNTGLGVPTGWYYWLPPNGGNDGLLSNGFENTEVTSEAAHTGMYSLKFDMPANRDPHDGFVGTKRYYFDSAQTNLYSSNVPNHDISHLTGIVPGDIIRIAVWIKADSLQPDSADANPVTWAVGLTPGFFNGNGNNIGYNPLVQNDYQFQFPHVTSFGWTQYYLDLTVPNDANALEVRLHVYARFTGKIYFDDLTVQKIGVTSVNNNHEMMPANFQVFQNYPNPFNPTTTINFALPQSSNVRIVIYDMLGREVRTLVDGSEVAGMHSIVWDGRNNFGSQVASGTYIYRVVAGSFTAVKKMILLK